MYINPIYEKKPFHALVRQLREAHERMGETLAYEKTEKQKKKKEKVKLVLTPEEREHLEIIKNNPSEKFNYLRKLENDREREAEENVKKV